MKKIISLILALACMVSVFALASCGKGEAASDKEYITEKGTMVLGITEYPPMNYKEDGEWTGFDTEFARAVGKELGVEVEFVVIEWNSKWTALSSKKIDAVWNGMTISTEAKENASVTDSYILNQQVVVMKADVVDNYVDVASMKELEFAAEAGSTGYDVAMAEELKVTEYGDMASALLAVNSGKVDACIIDVTMAKTILGEGTDYADLKAGIALKEEEYGIAFRKGSDMKDEVNSIIKEMMSDGTLDKLAEKYGLNLAK